MIDLIGTIALGILGAGAIALGIRFVAREPVRVRPFAGALLSLLFYWAVVVVGAEMQGTLFSDLKWNWIGKIVSAT